MGSIVPLQDLNFFPDPTSTTTAASAATTVIKIPKLEPKLEPWDEHHISSPIPNFTESNPISSEENNVYSEFYRVSELFRTAFARTNGDNEVSDPDSRAIVPVPEENSHHQVSGAVAPPRQRRSHQQRSSELVRVTDLGAEDQRYFRDVVRKTRMLYDSLRVFADEKTAEPGPRTTEPRRSEGGISAERPWPLCVVGLHGQAQAGIDYVAAGHSSSGEPIATSVIVSGGYEDDEDGGEVIIYSGHGGQDKHSKQCAHQKLEGGNLALERSMYYGIEVRVMRGAQYKLGRMGNQPEMGSAVLRLARSLRIEPLSFRPVGYLSLDISMNKENVPVGLFNDIDSNHEPMYYEYIVTTVFPPYAYHGANGNGCDCVSGCMDDCVCAMKNGGEFAYDQNGLLMRGKPLIFECGANCRCPPSCRNRVSQKGYAGVVLTREQAQLFTMNGDSLVYPNRFAERWAEWGDLSQIFSDYVRPAYPSIPPLDFAMDVSRMRNVACYISQSSSPNILVQLVLYDHNNILFPHLMLFAMENIPPLRELSLDYGVADEWTGKLRICN
ncbi:SU(VAR)3-9 homolog 9 [Actinidia rufa]|uniref:SU(VAR)3-9 homolog 9 n=1 Tax=Actinidia rufa TaxID=165716 RepID=A0A7J0E7T0_9ERIC|nr:SU(VAR)3-9 homolog 9 [Actinidia rufa]